MLFWGVLYPKEGIILKKINIKRRKKDVRKSTKRIVSSVLALSMLITSVAVNPTGVFATDYVGGQLEGYTFSTSTADGVKTSTWTFASTDDADKKDSTTGEVTVNGNVDPVVAAGDTFDGITVTGTGTKSWNSGNQFSVSKTMGFDIAVAAGSTGTVTITGTSKNTSRYLILEGDTTRTVPYTKDNNEIAFTADDSADGVLSFTNFDGDGGGDYKMSKIVVVENAASDDTTTTTTVADESSETTTADANSTTAADDNTEATTAGAETTTADDATETTTEATASSSLDFVAGDYAASKGLTSGDPAFKAGDEIPVNKAVKVTALQELDFTYKGGIDTFETAATINTGKLGIFHGMKSYFCQDKFGQIAPVYSISAGLDYPGIGPEHAYLHDIGRAEYVSITDEEAVNAFEYLAKTEGIIPAIESAHAVAYAMKLAPELSNDKIIAITISGRGDKDCVAIARYRGEDIHE